MQMNQIRLCGTLPQKGVTSPEDGNKIYPLTPGYITGLTQTDGSFSCAISISSSGIITFIPNLTITADLDSINVLYSVLHFFGCGRIHIDVKNHVANFVVTSRESFVNVIIPHFNKYPLFCYKLHAFNLLKSIIYSLLENKHKTEEGKLQLARMALSMNLGTTRTPERLQKIYSALGLSKNDTIALIPYSINNIEPSGPLTDDVLAGIIDGDGSFWISFLKTGQIKPGFSITADTASIPLLKEVLKRFNGVGSIQRTKETYSKYYVHGLNQILEVIIPFMDSLPGPLYSERLNHYQIFKKVSLILKTERPLSLETKLKIVDMSYDSNKNGKRRQLNKSEYIKLFIEQSNLNL